MVLLRKHVQEVVGVNKIDQLVDLLVAGETIEITQLTEEERRVLVYRFRKRYKKPLKMWYEMTLEKYTNEKGEPKVRRRLHIYMAVREV